MSGLTPFTALCSNGLFDDISNFITRAQNKEFKIDITKRDDKGRNILHMAIQNNFLGQTLEERLKIIKLFMSSFKLPCLFLDKGNLTELFKQFDRDGFIPLTSFIS